MTQGTDKERAIAALIGAGRTMNAWGEPIRAVERELKISIEAARAFVEELQHRGLVHVKGERATGVTPMRWWVCGDDKTAVKGE